MSRTVFASCIFLLADHSVAVSVEDLPLLRSDVSVYQVSSHNKQGHNGDGGWHLYNGEVIPNSLAGWHVVDGGTSVTHTRMRVRSGLGALKHTVRKGDTSNRWHSAYKRLSEGLNFQEFNRLTFDIWPTYADGGSDYGVRIDSGGTISELLITDLTPATWNHVELDLSDVARQGVGRVWLIFNDEWGIVNETNFYVDNLTLSNSNNQTRVIDDFESGRRRAVLFEAFGPGRVNNLWGLGGHDIQIDVDGRTLVNSSQDAFFTGKVDCFPSPLMSRELVASGPWKCISHFSFVPIEYRKHCRITTTHPEPFYHVIAERFASSRNVVSGVAQDEIADIKSTWDVVGPDPKAWTNLRHAKGRTSIKPGEHRQLVSIDSSGAVASIEVTVPDDKTGLESLWICMDWDGKPYQVAAPLAFFFGAGVEWRNIPSHCFGIEGNKGYNHFPMPFWEKATIRLENRGTSSIENVDFHVRWRTQPYPPKSAGYFRAQYREGVTSRGRDWLFLEAEGSGQLVGVVQRAVGGHYCEGDIRFYIDGSRSPSWYGTGTEDYYHQACWPNKDNHTPFHGCVGDVAFKAKQSTGTTFYDHPASYYRVHLEAPVRFCDSIRCGVEHGAENDTDSRYASLAFWYGKDQSGLLLTDTESFAHSNRQQVVGYFEGDDDDVRASSWMVNTAEPIKCRLSILPQNIGVRLRRTLDQSNGPQRAEVYIDHQLAGIWGDPDCNSYKRLAESDFAIDPQVTKNKDTLEIEFRPIDGNWTIGELRAFSHLSSDDGVDH